MTILLILAALVAFLATTTSFLLVDNTRLHTQRAELTEAFQHATNTNIRLSRAANTHQEQVDDTITILNILSRALGHSLNGRRAYAIALLGEMCDTNAQQ
jgi:predicted site-specific integrase-resolvase